MAFRQVMSEVEAEEMLDLILADEHGDLSYDTLILLSLYSAEIEAKVDEYRGAQIVDEDAKMHWDARRAEVMKALGR